MRTGGIDPHFEHSCIPQRNRGAGGGETASDQEQCSLPCSYSGNLWTFSGGPVVKNLPPQPGWEESWGRTDTCVCVAETLHYLPETIATLLIGYTPIRKKKLKKGICLSMQEMLVPFLVGS